MTQTILVPEPPFSHHQQDVLFDGNRPREKKTVLPFRLLFVVILQLSFLENRGQSNNYIHYTVPDGLPSSEVYSVFQDKEDFIWFATDNGVVRFDGKDMELFQANEGLSDPVVFGFVEDAKQRLWFRTFSGRVSYFYNRKIHSYPFNDTLASFCKNSYLASLYLDSKDQLWFSSESTLGRIDKAGSVTIERKMDSYTNPEIVFQNVENEIIIANGVVITRASKNKKPVSIKLLDTLARSNVYQVKWKGNRYFSFGKSIYQVEDQSITPAFTGPNQILSLYVDHRENLWIGYLQNGVECYSKWGTRKISHFDFVNSKSVTKVMQDKEGGFWIGTLEDGVYYVPYSNFFDEPSPFNQRIIRAAQWGEKTIVANIKGEVLVLDANGKVERKRELNTSILSLLCVSHNNLWVSTTNGTHLLDGSLNVKKIVRGNFSDLHLARDGTILGASGIHTAKFTQEGEPLDYFANNKACRSFFSNDRYFFRFGRLGMQVFTHSNNEVKLPSFFDALKVTKILTLNDSLILIGTLGSGFIIVNQDKWTFEPYSSEHKFMANNVYAFLKEGNDVWIGTEKGVAIASLKSIIARSPDFSFFITKNGKIDNKINHLVSSNQNIFAFSEDSFFILPTELTSQGLPKFQIQSLLINNLPDSMKEGQRLGYDKNNILINFRFIDFRNQNILVRSRLSSEDQWNYSSDRSIKFYSLRSTDYQLEIEYSTDNIHWHNATTWSFTVLPPWWRTWYFQLSIVLTAAIFLILYFKRRVDRVNERNSLINAHQQNLIRAELETQEAERNRIAQDLHDSVGTNLSALKMTVWSILKKYDVPKAKAVESDFQNTIRDIKGIIYDLVPAGLDKYGLVETLRGYTTKMGENLNIKIEVNSFGPDINDPKLNLLSFRILQELLANTLKHAQASKVVIHINSFDDLLSLLYQDNGRGFDLESVPKGSGLFNIESRVQTANGTLKFESGNFGVSYIIDIPLNHKEHDPNHLSG